jgi:TolB-like protein/Tfp pilus assembly protein PilF
LQIFKELQRRNVVRVTIGYIVSCWLLIQVADIVLENIGAPGWVMQTIMLVLALGFPVVAFFSWAYEVTPEGIKRESEIDRSESIVHVTGRKLDRAIFALMIVALGYFIWESRFSEKTIESDSDPVAIESVAEPPPIAEPAVNRMSIAVLPFDNRSNRQEDEFFTEGIHDDLLTTIANIGSMKVISRTSVVQYKDTEKTIPEIAKELGVANILEGGIQRSGDQVRINVQLIDAQTDEHLWAQTFDRELTAENLFAIQSEISKAIANALQATLSPEELRRIDTSPTDNLMAYNAYLKGKQLMATRETAKLRQAVEEFNDAVKLDPGFALAWVGVADSNQLLAMYAESSMDESFPTREQAIERALAINDQSGEAYTSLGTLLADRNEDEEAELAFQRAIQLNPNYATAYHWYSTMLGEDSFRIDERLQLIHRAAELDPRSSIISNGLADAYRDKGLLALAEQQYLNVIKMEPHFTGVYISLAWLYSEHLGRFDLAIEYALKAVAIEPGEMGGYLFLFNSYTALGQLDRAEAVRTSMEEVDPENRWVGYADVMLNLYRNNPEGAREAIAWTIPRMDEAWLGEYFKLFLGFIYLSVGDVHGARQIYLTAEPGWLESEQWPQLLRQFDVYACVMSWIFLQTGDEVLGERLLRDSIAYSDELSTVIDHSDFLEWEICYLAAGDVENALQILETKLAHNHLGSWHLNETSPMYDAIRHEPRYQAARLEVDQKIAAQREAIDLKMTLSE